MQRNDQDANNLLFTSIENENLQFCEIALSQGADPNLARGGVRIIHLAIQKQFTGLIRLLASNKRIDLTLKSSNLTPVQYADKHRNKAALEAIKGCLTDTTPITDTDLALLNSIDAPAMAPRQQENKIKFDLEKICLAIKDGDIAYLQEQVQAGLDLKSSLDHDGNTILHIAIKYRSFAVLEFALNNGAKVYIPNKYCQTPLAMAYDFYYWLGFLYLIKMHDLNKNGRFIDRDNVLIQHFNRLEPMAASQPDAPSSPPYSHLIESYDYFGIIQYFEENQVSPNPLKNSGLHVAVCLSNFLLIDYYILKGLNLKSRNSEGLTPVQLACQLKCSIILYYIATKHAEHLHKFLPEDQKILSAAKNIDAEMPQPSTYLAFIAAIHNADIATVQSIIGIIDPNKSVDKNLNTALHIAVSTGNQALLELLLLNNANPLQRNRAGINPCQLAINLDRWDLVAIIIKHNPHALAHLLQRDSRTAAMVMLMVDDKEFDEGKKFTFHDKDFYMPSLEYFLILACRHQLHACVITLLNKRIDIYTPIDNRLNTVLHYLASRSLRGLNFVYDPDKTNVAGVSVLQLLLNKSDWDGVCLLLDKVDKNQCQRFIEQEGEALFKLALQEGRHDIALKLLKIYPNLKHYRLDEHLNTFLHLIILANNTESLSVYVAYLKDNLPLFMIPNLENLTPLNITLNTVSPEVMRLVMAFSDDMLNEALRQNIHEKNVAVVRKLLAVGVSCKFMQNDITAVFDNDEYRAVCIAIADSDQGKFLHPLISESEKFPIPEDLEPIFECVISKEIMQKPRCVPQGTSFELENIRNLRVCPITRSPLNEAMLVQNKLLARLTLHYRMHACDVENPPSLLFCELSGKLFNKPVVAIDGETYERAFIEDYVKHNQGKLPTGNIQPADRGFYPNQNVEQLINDFYLRAVKKAKVEEKSSEGGMFAAANDNNAGASEEKKMKLG